MKLTNRNRSNRFARRAQSGLTLVEMLVSSGLFTLVIFAVIYSHLFGMRQDELVSSKLGASDQSRRGFELMARDVRSAKYFQVGNGSLSTFTPCANGTAQQGSAVQIYLTTATNLYVQYYFDTSNPANPQLRRRQTGVTGYKIIAQNLTNTFFFRTESYRGDVQTDLTHKGVLHVWLEFAQYQYPMTKVGPQYYYNYYKMEFRLTSHAPYGA